MDRKFEDRFETFSTELSSMCETMDNKFAIVDNHFANIERQFSSMIDRQFSSMKVELVEYLAPFIDNVGGLIDQQNKRISALEKRDAI